MTPSDACYHLTESSEGCALRAYQDTGGVWTIGYGHTKNVKPNDVITSAMAQILLEHDMEYASSVVNTHCLPCTQNQFDALVDFVFNVGPSQFLGSHLYQYHVSGEYDKAAAEFPKWKYDNGKVEPGLVVRRGLEQSLYTRQEPEADHPHTDGQGHSVSSVPCSVPANQEKDASQSSPAPPAQSSETVPASNNEPSGFVATALALLGRILPKK
jgi:lysozyme